ncbi:MAG TPA: hypothetical protein VFT22_22050 [Kofleriaceae bacterium]|nr:hypothetical protein [Kofleriaceae bacterium]
MTSAGRSGRHLHVREPDAVLDSFFATAAGDQPSPRVAVVLDRDQHHGLADDMDVQRQHDGSLDRTVQRPELPVIVGGLADDLDKKALAVRRLAARVGRRSHDVSAGLPAPASIAHMSGSFARRSDGR